MFFNRKIGLTALTSQGLISSKKKKRSSTIQKAAKNDAKDCRSTYHDMTGELFSKNKQPQGNLVIEPQTE